MSLYFVLHGDNGVLYKGNEPAEMRIIRDNYKGDRCTLYSYHKNGKGLDIKRSDWERDRTHKDAPLRPTHHVSHITLDEVSMKIAYEIIGRMLKSDQRDGNSNSNK